MTPRPLPANSCSTSSAPSRTSNAGSSPSVPATASPQPGKLGEHRVERRSTRRRFPPLRNSSRLDCHSLVPQNISALAGQRLTESQRRWVEVETEAFRSLSVILRTNLAMTPFPHCADHCWTGLKLTNAKPTPLLCYVMRCLESSSLGTFQLPPQRQAIQPERSRRERELCRWTM